MASKIIVFLSLPRHWLMDRYLSTRTGPFVCLAQVTGRTLSQGYHFCFALFTFHCSPTKICSIGIHNTSIHHTHSNRTDVLRYYLPKGTSWKLTDIEWMVYKGACRCLGILKENMFVYTVQWKEGSYCTGQAQNKHVPWPEWIIEINSTNQFTILLPLVVQSTLIVGMDNPFDWANNSLRDSIYTGTQTNNERMNGQSWPNRIRLSPILSLIISIAIITSLFWVWWRWSVSQWSLQLDCASSACGHSNVDSTALHFTWPGQLREQSRSVRLLPSFAIGSLGKLDSSFQLDSALVVSTQVYATLLFHAF